MDLNADSKSVMQQQQVFDLVSNYLKNATPQEQFYYVMLSAYSENLDHLRFLANQASTDLAVMKAMYWNLGADWFTQYADGSQVPDHERESWDLVQEIEQRCLVGFYKNQAIYFDPTQSECSRPDEYTDIKRLKPVPQFMKEPVLGNEEVDVWCNYSDDFADYEDGLPISLVEQIYQIYED